MRRTGLAAVAALAALVGGDAGAHQSESPHRPLCLGGDHTSAQPTVSLARCPCSLLRRRRPRDFPCGGAGHRPRGACHAARRRRGRRRGTTNALAALAPRTATSALPPASAQWCRASRRFPPATLPGRTPRLPAPSRRSLAFLARSSSPPQPCSYPPRRAMRCTAPLPRPRRARCGPSSSTATRRRRRAARAAGCEWCLLLSTPGARHS